MRKEDECFEDFAEGRDIDEDEEDSIAKRKAEAKGTKTTALTKKDVFGD